MFYARKTRVHQGIVIISMFYIITLKPMIVDSKPWLDPVDTLQNLVLQSHTQKIIEKAALLPEYLINYALSMQSPLKRKEKVALCEAGYNQRDWENEIRAFPVHAVKLEQRKKFLLDSRNIYGSKQFEWLCLQRANNTVQNYIANGYPVHAVLKKSATVWSGEYDFLTSIIDKNNFSLVTSKKRLNKTLFSINATNMSLRGNNWNLVQRLLDAGANINAINTRGQNFFYQLFYSLALTYSEPISQEVISFFDILLKKYNADINSAYSTQLLNELGYAHPHAVQYLVDNGINIFKNCGKCNGPLTSPVGSIFGKGNLLAYTSSWKKTKSIYLDKIKEIEKCPELFDKNKEGKTILHLTIEQWSNHSAYDDKLLLGDRKEIVKTLLTKGSLLTNKDNNSVTTSSLLLQWALKENSLLEVKKIVEECAQDPCKALFNKDLDECVTVMIE